MTQLDQSPAAEKTASGGGTSWRWWMAGVLFLATLLTYLDRQTLAICEKQIREEFHLNDEGYGRLVASFRWAYALMQVPAGMMADRLPLRTTFALAVGLWSLAGAAAAGVFRVTTLTITRAVLGMGECFNWPCSSRIVANTFPPADRSLASGIFNAGAAVGSLVAPLLIGGLAAAFGWRWAFFAIGVLGAVWIMVWIPVTAPRARCHAAVRFDKKFSTGEQWRFGAVFLFVGTFLPAFVIFFGPRVVAPIQTVFGAVADAVPHLRLCLLVGLTTAVAAALAWSLGRWRSRAVAFWMLIVVSATTHPCWYFMNDWLIKSLREDRQLDQRHVGGMAATLVVLTIIMLISDLGNLIGGAVIKFLVYRGRSLRAARAVAMLGAACLIAPVSLVSYVSYLPLATAMFGLAGMGLTSIIASHTACQQDFAFKRVGIISGLVGLTANAVYASANPAIGAHHDATHSYRLMFFLLGTLPLISVAAILVFDAIIHRGPRKPAAH